MKVLWTTNAVIGDMCEKENIPHPTGGGWMEVLLDNLSKETKDEIVVLTTTKINRMSYLKKGNISFYLLPCGHLGGLKYTNKKVNIYIKKVLEIEKPDLIHIWGTEYQFPLAVINCMGNLPTIIHIQGVMSTISRYCYAGMDRAEIRRAVSIRDIIRLDTINSQKKKFEKQALLENEMLSKVGNIIVENTWKEALCKSVNRNLKVTCPQNIYHFSVEI